MQELEMVMLKSRLRCCSVGPGEQTCYVAEKSENSPKHGYLRHCCSGCHCHTVVLFLLEGSCL